MRAQNNIRWDKEVDVIIIGFGGAGAVGAITAHDAGVSVCILEKQPEAVQVTNTSMGNGVFIQPNDVESAVRYMTGLNTADNGVKWTDEATVRSWSQYASQNSAWLEGLGARVNLFRKGGEHRHVPGYESIEIYRPAGMGFGLMRVLKKNVVDRNIEVLYETPARKLLTTSSGEVVGVQAEKDGKPLNFRARRAVIMALGGFEFNDEMKLNYLRVYPSYFTGTMANTGDGIKMVQEVGATLWHMNCCSARLVAKFPEFPIGFSVDYTGRGRIMVNSKKLLEPCAFIIVDRHGKRFTNEGEIKTHSLYYELTNFDSVRLEYPRVPSYWIFDSERMDRMELPIKSGAFGAHQLYKWSHDNRTEMAKGWIFQGKDIGELAQKLRIEAAILEKTVETYNGYCAQKRDPDFERPVEFLQPLNKQPFFAVRMFPGGPNTQGGPRRNARGQVLDVDGKPIRRLYAAGEFGSVFGMLYPASGGNISECIAYGRIVGENAAKEKSR